MLLLDFCGIEASGSSAKSGDAWEQIVEFERLIAFDLPRRLLRLN